MKVSQSQLARELGVSRQRVSAMVREGLITPDSKGRIDLDAALVAIAANRDPARGGKQTPVNESFHEARTRKERALATLREIEADEAAGRLVDAEEVQQAFVSMITTARTRLRAIPSKVAGELYHVGKVSKNQREGAAEIQKKLLAEVDEALQELSEYKPKTEGA